MVIIGEVLADNNGDHSLAIKDFERNLEKFRAVVPISTICMHGSPFSKWCDSDIWKNKNFRDYGILGEAFLSIDYNKVRYFTDTEGSWNNSKFNIRDSVKSNLDPLITNSTFDLISLLSDLDTNISINVHSQRWDDSFLFWTRELFTQSSKNIVKEDFKMESLKVESGLDNIKLKELEKVCSKPSER